MNLFKAQHGQTWSVRTTKDLHDRHPLVDGFRCFSSGASFKDGAKNAGTTTMQIVDVFDAVQLVYEDLWTTGVSPRNCRHCGQIPERDSTGQFRLGD